MRSFSALVVALCLVAFASSAQTPRVFPYGVRNFSFESSDFTGADGVMTPDAWKTRSLGNAGGTYKIGLDSAQHLDGKLSLRSVRDDAPSTTVPTWGAAMAEQWAPLRAGKGAILRLIGWIRTQNLANGAATLWLRIHDTENRQLKLEELSEGGAKGTTAWTRYVLEVPIDSGAIGAFFGVQHKGTGAAWFDSIRLEIVYKPSPASKLPVHLLRPL